MSNSLTRRASLTVGPLFLETLVKHYFARVVGDDSKNSVPLRKEVLLYDEVFNIAKDFMEIATRHTVEDLQAFANVRTPSPPSVHVVRIVIPMSCCDQAANYLIEAFGGVDEMKKVVGGVKWWQVRGIRGLDAEWVSTKKDWKSAQRRAKERRSSTAAPQEHAAERPELHRPSAVPEPPLSPGGEAGHQSGASKNNETPRDSATYQPEMDEMRCILFSHGGGYYFGSVDQERYTIQRLARKIRGRVLAVNYRLAPQYPFPCAIQDLVAAYHQKAQRIFHVRPEHIVIAGDSAGGGLSLALLQIIRDSGLPAPAGGVLISPWCDLNHSFPSVLSNTDTDVIPSTGLCLHKPSPLWPPPSNDVSSRVHNGLRKSIVDVYRRSKGAGRTPQASRPSDPDDVVPESPTTSGPMNVGSTASPTPPEFPRFIEVPQQVQLYAPNGLLRHPLVSPALSYLGGLPPLFFTAGDREVLRDEIIYTAHRAAHPERFPVPSDTKDLYQPFKDDDFEKHMRPTSVHIQVYDDVGHVLPVLFPFTTPGKYCFRALALFCKHVTNMQPALPSSPGLLSPMDHHFITSPASLTPQNEVSRLQVPSPKVHRSLSTRIQHAATGVKRRSSLWSRPSAQATGGSTMYSVENRVSSGQVTPISDLSDVSVDVAGPRIGGNNEPQVDDVPRPGEAWVYAGNWVKKFLSQSAVSRDMIRERVSTQGIIRTLEPESELPALQVPPELVGAISEHAVRRYVAGTARFEKRFARAIKHIAKQRQQNIDRASRDANQHLEALQKYFDRKRTSAETGGVVEPSWNLAWALEADERPPPSSIVARRDTKEALELARVADKAILATEESLSANNLWNVIVGFVTVSPDDHPSARSDGGISPRAGEHVVGAQTGRTGRLRSFLRKKQPEGSQSGSGQSSSGQ
ncbi:lipase/ esterase [Lactarius akahatsu]|uniref:Lipase/ esterase n=1 Tax=Lactarius akahatsu TaxID=416441 RepID=A0AAD4QAJ6_9AGAM|nr:lipase/ esterase [Lactarius akahatsu]